MAYFFSRHVWQLYRIRFRRLLTDSLADDAAATFAPKLEPLPSDLTADPPACAISPKLSVLLGGPKTRGRHESAKGARPAVSRFSGRSCLGLTTPLTLILVNSDRVDSCGRISGGSRARMSGDLNPLESGEGGGARVTADWETTDKRGLGGSFGVPLFISPPPCVGLDSFGLLTAIGLHFPCGMNTASPQQLLSSIINRCL
jgi:hypothetical protein